MYSTYSLVLLYSTVHGCREQKCSLPYCTELYTLFFCLVDQLIISLQNCLKYLSTVPKSLFRFFPTSKEVLGRDGVTSTVIVITVFSTLVVDYSTVPYVLYSFINELFCCVPVLYFGEWLIVLSVITVNDCLLFSTLLYYCSTAVRYSRKTRYCTCTVLYRVLR